MPLSMKSLSELRRTVVIQFADEQLESQDLNITYRLSAMNQELSDWLDAHKTERTSLIEWIKRIVVGWDITDDAGQNMSVSEETMAILPTTLLHMIVSAVYEDADSKNLRAVSPGPLASALATSQNGTR